MTTEELNPGEITATLLDEVYGYDTSDLEMLAAEKKVEIDQLTFSDLDAEPGDVLDLMFQLRHKLEREISHFDLLSALHIQFSNVPEVNEMALRAARPTEANEELAELLGSKVTLGNLREAIATLAK